MLYALEQRVGIVNDRWWLPVRFTVMAGTQKIVSLEDIAAPVPLNRHLLTLGKELTASPNELVRSWSFCWSQCRLNVTVSVSLFRCPGTGFH